MSPTLLDADLGATEIGQKAREVTLVADVLADMFGDPFSRALYRETKYAVRDSERSTCPVHQDWRHSCSELHFERAA